MSSSNWILLSIFEGTIPFTNVIGLLRYQWFVQPILFRNIDLISCQRVVFKCASYLAGMIFFRYLTDFSYFPLERNYRKLLVTVRTCQNGPFERGCTWFQLLFLDFRLFYFQAMFTPDVGRYILFHSLHTLIFPWT